MCELLIDKYLQTQTVELDIDFGHSLQLLMPREGVIIVRRFKENRRE
jgi:hypothetical protein